MTRNAAAVVVVAICLMATPGWSTVSAAEVKAARVGVLYGTGGNTTTERFMQWSEPFRSRLAVEGWVEGKSITFVYRTDARSKLDDGARDLVRLNVDVIYAADAPSVRAAYAATRVIPIVAGDGTTDPIAAGYIASYARPGGNLTGVFLNTPALTSKWLELLQRVVPSLSRALVLWDSRAGQAHLAGIRDAATSMKIRLQVVEVRSPEAIETAFASLRGSPQALVILPSPMMFVQSEQLATLTLKHHLPAASMFRPFAEAGGLLAYGHDMASLNERCAVLVAKILAGEKPAEIPVEGPLKFALVVNLKTASALGLIVPESVLIPADTVLK